MSDIEKPREHNREPQVRLTRESLVLVVKHQKQRREEGVRLTLGQANAELVNAGFKVIAK